MKQKWQKCGGSNIHIRQNRLYIKGYSKRQKGNYIMIKGSKQEEAIILINIYTPNTGAPKYIKQILRDVEGKTENNTIILGNFTTPLISMDKSSRQKVNKATVVLNDTIDQLDLIDIHWTLNPKIEYTFFSSAPGILQDRSHPRPQNKSQRI